MFVYRGAIYKKTQLKSDIKITTQRKTTIRAFSLTAVFLVIPAKRSPRRGVNREDRSPQSGLPALRQRLQVSIFRSGSRPQGASVAEEWGYLSL
jgi:hypothetical protein